METNNQKLMAEIARLKLQLKQAEHRARTNFKNGRIMKAKMENKVLQIYRKRREV